METSEVDILNQLESAGIYVVSKEQAGKIPIMPREELDRHIKAVQKYLPPKRMNQINLYFDKDVTGLVGSAFGYFTYRDQVEPVWEDGWLNIIRFPSHIEEVSMAFVDGLFRLIIQKYSGNDIRRHVDIKASNDFIVNKIWACLNIKANG